MPGTGRDNLECLGENGSEACLQERRAGEERGEEKRGASTLPWRFKASGCGAGGLSVSAFSQ